MPSPSSTTLGIFQVAKLKEYFLVLEFGKNCAAPIADPYATTVIRW